MWRRKTFNWLFHKRGEAARWANLHPKAMMAGMFCLMACGTVWLIFDRGDAKGSFDDSVRQLYSGFNKNPVDRSAAADMLEAWRLYSEVQHINPDSLTARDSTLLKDIDQQLNSIIHE